MAYQQPLSTHILVTGAAGLIGSAVTVRLNELGYHNITITDHLGQSEKWKNLRAISYKRYFEKDQFEEMLDNGKAPDDIQVIFHLGACSSTTERDASYLAKNNYNYTVKLADFAANHGIRMIYASSAATYGNGENGFSDNEALVPNLRPLNMYGHSKQMFDQYLLGKGLLCTPAPSGASFVGMKFSNVFGPNEYHKGNMRSMVMRAFEQISENGTVGLFKSYRKEYADGEQVRDFLYVKDAADMAVFFMNGGAACNGLYNIGFGATRSWNELARAVFAAMKRPVDIRYIEMPEGLRDRYQYYTCLDITKIRKAGYTRQLTTLEAAVEDYVRYLQTEHHLGDRIRD